MKPNDNELLHTEVHIDEFFFDGNEENKQGRYADREKLRASLAVEILPNDKGKGRVYAMQIENFSADQLLKTFVKYCAPKTLLITDKWRSYTPFVHHFPNLNQILSEKDEAFPELRIVILLIKKFLKGIQHTISKQRFKNYLDECSYRLNRLNFIESTNENLIYQLTKHIPTSHKRKLEYCIMAA